MTLLQMTAVQVLMAAAIGCWAADRLRLAIKYCDGYVQEFARQWAKAVPKLFAGFSLLGWTVSFASQPGSYGLWRDLERAMILAFIGWLSCSLSVFIKSNFGGVWETVGGSDGL